MGEICAILIILSILSPDSAWARSQQQTVLDMAGIICDNKSNSRVISQLRNKRLEHLPLYFHRKHWCYYANTTKQVTFFRPAITDVAELSEKYGSDRNLDNEITILGYYTYND